MQELTKPNHRNHVELVYTNGSSFKIRNVDSVQYHQKNGKVVIFTSAKEEKNITEGVKRLSATVESTVIDVGQLAGLVVSHTSDEAMNRFTLNTTLTFIERGEFVGGIAAPLTQIEWIDFAKDTSRSLVDQMIVING